jgi:hypothetical protein
MTGRPIQGGTDPRLAEQGKRAIIDVDVSQERQYRGSRLGEVDPQRVVLFACLLSLAGWWRRCIFAAGRLDARRRRSRGWRASVGAGERRAGLQQKSAGDGHGEARQRHHWPVGAVPLMAAAGGLTSALEAHGGARRACDR